ncbi:DUF2975 domain-containing protein [Neisseria sp. Ec49-e6-T10]|uniref:DUF2975 domain-containing protein n=1 Tax=Neisseria sp. Ec49-e6-T10 TaxID=3140744 RepID=UPI003EC04B96
MKTLNIAHASQRMAMVTLFLIGAMLLLNTLSWFLPILASVEGGYGLSFSLTDRLISGFDVNILAFPWWQKIGGVVLSSIPLLILANGLYQLYLLFQNFSQGQYFSVTSANYLGKVGRSVMLWVVLDFLCEPLLSMWMTINAASGDHLITLSITASSLVALFLAGCITIIAHILRQASIIEHENKQFI